MWGEAGASSSSLDELFTRLIYDFGKSITQKAIDLLNKSIGKEELVVLDIDEAIFKKAQEAMILKKLGQAHRLGDRAELGKPDDILHRLNKFFNLFLSDSLNSEFAYQFGLKNV